jgi:hypothetical protein
MVTNWLVRLLAPICIVLAQPVLAAAAEEPVRIGLIVPLTGGVGKT